MTDTPETQAAVRPPGAASSRNREAHFLGLLEAAKPGLTRFCWAMTRDEQDAADLLSDTVMQAWLSFASLRDPKAFPKFCLTIARRAAASIWRRRSRQAASEQWTELLSDATPPDVRSDIGRLQAALKQLPRKQREAVALFELSGFSLNEIQALQGGSLSGVKSRLRRGRAKLAEILGVEDAPHGEG